MSNEIFIALAALACAALLAWGFVRLPGENRQFLACLPLAQEAPGQWRGLNLTWYGLLSANAQAAAAALFLLLATSLGLPWSGVAGLLAALTLICLAGSRWLAQVVEKKAHTFTVGGAAFLGLVAAPALFWLANAILEMNGGQGAPLIAWAAALTSAYALGEGLGRLACISFGCCYGKPLDQCPAWLQRLFARHSFRFRGHTKKIAYASGLEGIPVLPVQAITAVVLVAAALAGAYLFLRGAFAASLVASGVSSQLWRVASEFLRADYRGQGRFSAYQWMALAAALWLGLLAWLLPAAPAGPRPDLALGALALWAPGPLVFIQGIWLVAFAYFGRSRVTTSRLSFSVRRDLI
ncbi:MAG: prolipoprotein diacylglyceryl transferase family protein [Thermodesulfobacteriota bacterium]